MALVNIQKFAAYRMINDDFLPCFTWCSAVAAMALFYALCVTQMCTSLDSLQQSLTVVQHQMSRAADQPLSLDVDSLHDQMANHDVLMQYLTTHEVDIGKVQAKLNVPSENTMGMWTVDPCECYYSTCRFKVMAFLKTRSWQ